MKNLTLNEVTDKVGAILLEVRLDGAIIKTFTKDQEVDARRFFHTFTLGRESVTALAQRFVPSVTEAKQDDQLAELLNMMGAELWLRTIMKYRGFTILDRPYGESPFTIVRLTEGILPTIAEDDSLAACLNTIDYVEDEKDQDHEDTWSKPNWRRKEIERWEQHNQRQRKEAGHE